jgi:regulator of replication initiation timing
MVTYIAIYFLLKSGTYTFRETPEEKRRERKKENPERKRKRKGRKKTVKKEGEKGRKREKLTRSFREGFDTAPKIAFRALRTSQSTCPK